MTQQSQPLATVIAFHGVQLALPASLPFTYQDNCLVLDFTLGYTGKLVIKPGTQSPFQKEKQVVVTSQEQPAAVSLQQQEAHKRNAAALQELMTQADASEPEADDFVADTAVDTGDKADASTPSKHEAADSDGAAAAATTGNADKGGISSQSVQTKLPAVPAEPDEPAVHQDTAETGRGAGTPAGPQEEFYSPQEHFQGESAEQRDIIMEDADVPKMKQAEGVVQQPATEAATSEAAGLPAQEAGPAADARQPAQEAADAADAKQPAQEAAFAAKTPLPSKTPANAKRRKGSKSVPPSSKRRKATPAALAEASFSWRALDSEWDKEGAGPCDRWATSLTCTADNKVCLLGGGSIEGKLYDAWILDVGNDGWRRLPSADLPIARAWHSAHMLQTEQGQQLVVYGGENDPTDYLDENTAGYGDEDDKLHLFNDLCLLEPDMRLWVTVPITGKGGKGPPARTGHSCTVLPDGRLLIFGGVADNGKCVNDMFLIDVKRLTWYKMAAKGAPPKGRAYHSATMVGDKVVFMGGMGKNDRAWSLKEVYTLNTESWKWTEHTSEVEGEAPSPRYGHCAVALSDDRYLVTFGGGDQRHDMFFSSVALLDTLTWRWSTPKIQGMARPSGRSGHGMALVTMPGNKAGLVVFGGQSKNDILHNDTWLLELPNLAE